MAAELLAFITVVALAAAIVGLMSSRSSQRRMWRLESRLSESERLRLELLRQNGELRLQLDTTIKSMAVKPTRSPSPRAATPPGAGPTEADAKAPTTTSARKPTPPGSAGASATPIPTPAPASSWEDTQPFTTAPSPFSPQPAGSLFPRLRNN